MCALASTPVDSRVNDQLRAIEGTLTDTVRLGEAMLTEFAQQTETLETAQAHTQAVVRDADEARHVVRAMQSTPYALWRWCVGWWTWLWAPGGLHARPNLASPPSPLTDAATAATATATDGAPGTTAASPLLPPHVEAQIHTLHAQAHALGAALDTHLHLLDDIRRDVDDGSARLETVPFRSTASTLT